MQKIIASSGNRPPQAPYRKTLAESTAHILLDSITAGRWINFLPGERTLCEELQISRPTLRQALKTLEHRGWIKTTERKRRQIVTEKIKKKARAQNKTVSILSPQPLRSLPPITLFYIDTVRSYLSKQGYQLQFHSSRASITQRPGQALNNLVKSNPSALWVLLRATQPVQEWFQAQHLPCLVAGSCEPNITLPSIDVDYRAVCHHAVGVFKRKGHQRLALVVPTNGLIGDEESEIGFCEAAKNDLPPLIIRYDGSREDLIRKLDHSLQMKSPPTGFLITRQAHVLTLLTLLNQRGIKVPEQVGVISRDDEAFLDFVIPRVTRYTLIPETFARKLARLVVQMIHTGPSPDHPVRLMPTFLPGETV